MINSSVNRSNIIGGNEVQANTAVFDKQALHETNTLFWDTRGSDLLGETSLPEYGSFLSEDKCRLFGEITGARVLEIGC